MIAWHFPCTSSLILYAFRVYVLLQQKKNEEKTTKHPAGAGTQKGDGKKERRVGNDTPRTWWYQLTGGFQ